MIEPVALALLQLLGNPLFHRCSRIYVPIARCESLGRILHSLRQSSTRRSSLVSVPSRWPRFALCGTEHYQWDVRPAVYGMRLGARAYRLRCPETARS
jgi:hypothetical protein